jgi:cell division protein FtsB
MPKNLIQMSRSMDPDAPRADPAAPKRPRSRPRRHRPAHEIKQRRRRIVSYALIAGAFVLMVNALVGENGYLANLRARQEHQELEAELSRLRRENQQYLEQVHQLKSDPGALEEAARRVLGFVRPGETLVIIRDAGRTQIPQ